MKTDQRKSKGKFGRGRLLCRSGRRRRRRRQEIRSPENPVGLDEKILAVEAAIGMGWERYIGMEGVFVGMVGFGASAPAPDLYRHFNITPEAVAVAVRAQL